MAKTIRKVNPKIARSGAFSWDARKRHMLLKGVKTFRSDKCSDARIDSEGNTRLDTWSECPAKTGSLANRKIRTGHKINTRKRLEEVYA